MFYEVAALGAALCWTFAAFIAGDLSKQIGGITFNRLRNVGVFFVLLIFVSFAGLWETFRVADLGIILISGFIGIAIGDSFLFCAMQRIGPRRSELLYACNAPISVILGIYILGESLNFIEVIGIIIISLGVLAAIKWGKPKSSNVHRWEITEGNIMIGIGFGLIAALGQSIGSIIIKPVLDNGANPMLVSMMRVGVSALFLTIMFYVRNVEPVQTITNKHRALATLNGILAIGIGVSLLLYAYSVGGIGIASILSSTQAVMMLPIIWLKTKQRPTLGAWIGAILVVVGLGLMYY